MRPVLLYVKEHLEGGKREDVAKQEQCATWFVASLHNGG